MKFLFDILKNPFALTTVFVHWWFFFYAIFFEETPLFSNSLTFPRSDYIYQWLETLNVIPLTIIGVAGNFLDIVIGMNFLLNNALVIFALLLVNFQWLFIGYCLSKLFFNSKEIKFSLK